MTGWRRWGADVVLVVAMLVDVAMELGLDPPDDSRVGVCGVAAVVVSATALVLTHRRPGLAGVVLSMALPTVVGLASLLHLPPGTAVEVLPDTALAAVALVAYRIGRDAPAPTRWLLLGLMLVTLQGADVVWGEGDPVLTFSVGLGWAGGRVIGSLRTATRSLDEALAAVRAEESEQARLAVLTERRRMVRELHDVIGHTMTVVVVQAAAGRHLAREDPSGARRSLLAISAAARSVAGEVERLRVDEALPPGLRDLPGLVEVAAATGTPVRLAFSGPAGSGPSTGAGAAAYEVVRESLTNALRHAPGASVQVEVGQDGETLSVTVRNTAAASDGRSTAGSRLGLEGLRDRVEGLGGRLEVGPEPDGGWSVLARLPLCEQRLAARSGPVASLSTSRASGPPD